MSLRVRLVLGYTFPVLMSTALYVFLYRPERTATSERLGELSRVTEANHKRSQQLLEFPSQLARVSPLKPPPPETRLASVRGVQVEGLAVTELAIEGGKARFGLNGGAREVASWLEAVQALPFSPRVAALSLNRATEGNALAGIAVVEAGP